MMNEFAGDTAPRSTVQVPVLDRELTTELSGDFSLPDYQPEIKRLLRIGTSVLPPNCFAGRDGVELGGTVDYFVLYVGHDNGVYCAPLSTEYRVETEPDAEGRALPITADSIPLCLCDTYAEAPVGRVTAPRRLNIRCKLRMGIKLYGECSPSAKPAGGDDGTEEALPAMEALSAKATVNRVYCGLGDVLPLQDDLILSPTDGEWRVVCAESKVLVTEATPAAGQVNCHGEVTVKLTLCPAETEAEFASNTAEGRTSPPLTILQRKIPFSQAVELEGVTPVCAATAHGYCSDISVEMEEGHVHVDMNVSLEARAQRNEEVYYVKDAYSTRRESVCRYTDLPAERGLKALNGNFTLSDSLPLSEVGIDPAARIADVTVSATPDSLTADPAKGRCYLSGTCHCHLLLLRDGEYAAAEMDLPFRYEFDEPGFTKDGISEGQVPTLGLPAFDGSISVVNCRARMDGERVGVDAELAVSLRTYRPAPLTALTDVELGEEVTRRRGEYVICFPAPTDSAWSVAKRYHAPMAALTAANNLPASTDTDSIASLEGVGYLIV